VIVGTVSGVAQTQDDIEQKGAAIIGSVKQTITRLSMQLASRVKEQKLSGQVLNVRTGRLRRSITFSVNEQDGAVVGLVGTNVEYARPLEFGGTMDERVREHMRTIKQAWGKALKNPKAVQVRAHTRHVVLPERSFLRSALGEMQATIQSEIGKAVEAGCGARS
jgi:phage gpG-like protein